MLSALRHSQHIYTIRTIVQTPSVIADRTLNHGSRLPIHLMIHVTGDELCYLLTVASTIIQVQKSLEFSWRRCSKMKTFCFAWDWISESFTQIWSSSQRHNHISAHHINTTAQFTHPTVRIVRTLTLPASVSSLSHFSLSHVFYDDWRTEVQCCENGTF